MTAHSGKIDPKRPTVHSAWDVVKKELTLGGASFAPAGSNATAGINLSNAGYPLPALVFGVAAACLCLPVLLHAVRTVRYLKNIPAPKP